MNNIMMGVVGTSRKENEHRIPLHPDQLDRLPEGIRRQLVFEEGYGLPFGMPDRELAARSGGVASRQSLFSDIGNVLIPKPEPSDLRELKQGGVVWGWVHCVQQPEMTQEAIDRRLTLIAFEDMFVWSPTGVMGRHTFYKNNELAGYCAVLHALQLKGIDGHYGNQRKVLIFSFGAVSRGAIYALKARGFRDITICIQRPDHEVREEVLGCHYLRVREGGAGEPRMLAVEHDGTERPLIDLIAEADILVNGTFQDPDHPIQFVIQAEVDALKRGSLIIDVSCDDGMGFPFARPTTFAEPMLRFGQVEYYAVDHTPSYLWESASRSVSAALIVHLPDIVAGRKQWAENTTLQRAINIDRGVVLKREILSFQGREAEYPHNLIKAPAAVA